MFRTIRLLAYIAAIFIVPMQCHAQAASSSSSPVSVSVYDRTRVDTWQWFAAPPESNSYAYVESLLRISLAQRMRSWDWQLELAQPSVLDAPNDAISPVTAQGQLGLGAHTMPPAPTTPIRPPRFSSKALCVLTARIQSCVSAASSSLMDRRFNRRIQA